MTTRICPKCGVEKDEELFRRGNAKIQDICNKCVCKPAPTHVREGKKIRKYIAHPIEYRGQPESWMDTANHGETISADSLLSYPSGISYVYFVRSAGLIKIGKADVLIERLLSLAGSGASEISLLGYIAVRREEVFLIEAQLHEKFKEYRRHGEWFEENGLLHKYILAVCDLDCNKINSRLRNFYKTNL